MTRTMKNLALAALLALAGRAVAADKVSDGVVKIGVLTDMTGYYSDLAGPGSVLAVKMAVADFGGKMLGKPIEVISADHQNKADIASNTARKWFDEDKVDVAVDLHEAELQYPVISTIVTHQRGQDLATMSAMMLADNEGFKIGTEYSPKNLHGLSHREIGDFSPAVSLLFETPEPFLDATRGRTTSEQLLTGRDPFVVKAGEHGLLYEKIDDKGWPIAVRVGRHASSIAQVMETWSEDHPDNPIAALNVPRYREVIQRGVGYYLQDPSKAKLSRLAYE